MTKTTVRAAKKRVVAAAMRRFNELCASEDDYVAIMLKCNHTAAAKTLVRACAALQRAKEKAK